VLISHYAAHVLAAAPGGKRCCPAGCLHRQWLPVQKLLAALLDTLPFYLAVVGLLRQWLEVPGAGAD